MSTSGSDRPSRERRLPTRYKDGATLNRKRPNYQKENRQGDTSATQAQKRKTRTGRPQAGGVPPLGMSQQMNQLGNDYALNPPCAQAGINNQSVQGGTSAAAGFGGTGHVFGGIQSQPGGVHVGSQNPFTRVACTGADDGKQFHLHQRPQLPYQTPAADGLRLPPASNTATGTGADRPAHALQPQTTGEEDHEQDNDFVPSVEEEEDEDQDYQGNDEEASGDDAGSLEGGAGPAHEISDQPHARRGSRAAQSQRLHFELDDHVIDAMSSEELQRAQLRATMRLHGDVVDFMDGVEKLFQEIHKSNKALTSNNKAGSSRRDTAKQHRRLKESVTGFCNERSMWPEASELELLASRAISSAHRSGKELFEKDYNLMIELIDAAQKWANKGPRAQAVKACKEAITEVYTGTMLSQAGALKPSAKTTFAGVRYRSHGADPYDQEDFRRAALLAFKAGGDEADVNSIDHIYPAQWALLELLVTWRLSGKKDLPTKESALKGVRAKYHHFLQQARQRVSVFVAIPSAD